MTGVCVCVCGAYEKNLEQLHATAYGSSVLTISQS